MGTVDKFLWGAFGLILVYLLVNPTNQAGVNSILGNLTTFTGNTFATLQGRSYSTLGGAK